MSEKWISKKAKAVEKLEAVKRVMRNREKVTYDGKLYRVQAIRMCDSELYDGIVYQAELVSTDPARWNYALYVALEKLELSGV